MNQSNNPFKYSFREDSLSANKAPQYIPANK